MENARDRGPGRIPAMGAGDYGRNAESLPDLHVFSRLSELDEACAADLAMRRARQETLAREIGELARRLAAPLEGGPDRESVRRGSVRRGSA
jgi:hypothetical protein